MSNFIYIIIYYLFFEKLIYVVMVILAGVIIYKIRKKPYKFKNTIDKGNHYYEEKEYEKALKCYSDAIDIYPKKTAGYIEKCCTLIKMNKPKEVLEVCNTWLQLDPNDVFAYYDRIWAYQQLNEFDLDKSSASAYKNYAYALIKLNKLDLAKQYIDKAIDLKETYGNIYIVLSMINLLENDSENFYKNLNLALEKKVANVDYLDDSIFDKVREDVEFIKIYTSLKDRCH